MSQNLKDVKNKIIEIVSKKNWESASLFDELDKICLESFDEPSLNIIQKTILQCINLHYTNKNSKLLCQTLSLTLYLIRNGSKHLTHVLHQHKEKFERLNNFQCFESDVTKESRVKDLAKNISDLLNEQINDLDVSILKIDEKT